MSLLVGRETEFQTYTREITPFPEIQKLKTKIPVRQTASPVAKKPATEITNKNSGELQSSPQKLQPYSEGPKAGSYIRSVYINPDVVDANTVIPELVQIGVRRGFRVNTSSGVTPWEWSQDSGILIERGKATGTKGTLLVTTMDPALFKQSVVKLVTLGGPGVGVYDRTDMSDHFGLLGDVGTMGKAITDRYHELTARTAREHGWEIKTSPVAIEGGNLLTMVDSEGRPKAIIGRNTLLANWIALKDSGQIPENAVQNILANKQFDAAVVQNLQALYLHSKNPVSHEQAHRMAAEIEVCKQMIAEALNLDVNALVFVEQYEFHIDMATRPLAPGVIAVSDLDASIVVLDNAIAELQRKRLNAGGKTLQEDDIPVESDSNGIEIMQLSVARNYVLQMIQNGAQVQNDRKASTLEKSGLKVERIAMNFGKIGGFLTGVDINFANALTSYDKDGRLYMVTNRSYSPTVNSAFEKTMKDMGIDVEWVSTNDWLLAKGGINCKTLQSSEVP